MAETYDTEWQLATLRESVASWNQWRKEHPEIKISLSGANLVSVNLRRANLSGVGLSGADLGGANLSGANLSEAHLNRTHLFGADLRTADLHTADLRAAYLRKADLGGANLRRANLSKANLSKANLSGADLSGADLSHADLTMTSCVGTNFTEATLSGCRVYGISSWDVRLDKATQQDLCITPPNQPEVTVDNLKVAQFIYLLLANAEIRDVIDSITTKVVLILGRFTAERKAVLDALRNELRKQNYLPVLFDFQGPKNKDIVETVTLLARMARFIIADLTDAAMVRSELMLIVPALPSVPVQPLLKGTAPELPEIAHLKRFRSMLPLHSYDDLPDLLADLSDNVIAPAEAKVKELRKL